MGSLLAPCGFELLSSSTTPACCHVPAAGLLLRTSWILPLEVEANLQIYKLSSDDLSLCPLPCPKIWTGLHGHIAALESLPILSHFFLINYIQSTVCSTTIFVLLGLEVRNSKTSGSGWLWWTLIGTLAPQVRVTKRRKGSVMLKKPHRSLLAMQSLWEGRRCRGKRATPLPVSFWEIRLSQDCLKRSVWPGLGAPTVMPVSREAETGRSKVQCQPKQYRVEGSSPYQDPISKKKKRSYSK